MYKKYMRLRVITIIYFDDDYVLKWITSLTSDVEFRSSLHPIANSVALSARMRVRTLDCTHYRNCFESQSRDLTFGGTPKIANVHCDTWIAETAEFTLIHDAFACAIALTAVSHTRDDRFHVVQRSGFSGTSLVSYRRIFQRRICARYALLTSKIRDLLPSIRAPRSEPTRPKTVMAIGQARANHDESEWR